MQFIVKFMIFLSVFNLVGATVYHSGVVDLTTTPAFHKLGNTLCVPSNHSWFSGGAYNVFIDEIPTLTPPPICNQYGGILPLLTYYSVSFVVMVIICSIIGYFDMPCELFEPYLEVLDYIYYPMICFLILTEGFMIWAYQKAYPPPPKRWRNFSIYDDPLP